MTMRVLPGPPSWYPGPPGRDFITNTAPMSYSVTDANGEKFGAYGRVWWPGAKIGDTKAIRRVILRLTSVTKGGSTTCLLSLQAPDLTTGPVIRPTETPQQSVTLTNAQLAAGWLRTDTLDTDRTVTAGDLFFVVGEFSVFNAGDSIVWGVCTKGGTTMDAQGAGFSMKIGAPAWASDNHFPMLFFECSDGSYAIFEGAVPFTVGSSAAFNTGAANKEFCVELEMPCAMNPVGMWMALNSIGAGADCELRIYDSSDNVLMGPTTIDANALYSGSTPIVRCLCGLMAAPPQYGQKIYLACKPTTANSIYAYVNTFYDAASMALFAGGGKVRWGYRATAGSGAWTFPSATTCAFGIQYGAAEDGIFTARPRAMLVGGA